MPSFFGPRPTDSLSAPEGEGRILFLDDDPARAAEFLSECPEAVWVQTVAECLEHLYEFWDEVHLDHDLGGEMFVDSSRDDCGMAVVRWLGLQPRPHLKETRFFIHSHNVDAACAMVLHMQALGYRVEARPFRCSDREPAPAEVTRPTSRGWFEWLRSLGRRSLGWTPRIEPDSES